MCSPQYKHKCTNIDMLIDTYGHLYLKAIVHVVCVCRISVITVLLPGAHQQQIRLSKCREEKVKILLKQRQTVSI